MRKIILRTIFLLLLSCPFSSLLAQAPQKMSYQAILRNSSSELIVNTTVGMRISIVQGSEDGIQVYTEVQTPSTNTNGLVTLAIGTGTVLTGSFSAINWGNGPYFIKTETDPQGGNNYSITGISQFMSVPYALFAANSGSSVDGKSAYEIWKEQSGNENKTEADFLIAIKGMDGKSAFEVWKELPGNEDKTEADFIEGIKGADGLDGIDGLPGEDGMVGEKGDTGVDGKSAFEIWKELPGNEDKTTTDFMAGIKGAAGSIGPKGDTGLDGKSAFEVWKELPGNEDKTMADFIAGIKGAAGAIGPKGDTGLDGKSAFEVWKELPGNEDKTATDFMAGIKGADGIDGLPGADGAVGPKGDTGVDGKSAFEVWKELPGNEDKTTTDFMAGIKGADGIDGLPGAAGAIGPKGDIGVDGKSAFEVWKELPGNEDKTATDFIAGIKGVDGIDGLPGADGAIGPKGDTGVDGKSTFEVWKELPGNEDKTTTDFIASIKGTDGIDGLPGSAGTIGPKGDTGIDGKSAFEVWKELPGNEDKTTTDFMADIKGADGIDGLPGADGAIGPKGDTGVDGKSTFEVWKELPGNENKTESDFIENSKGAKGDTGADGKSAYEIWKEKEGNSEKSLADYEASLVGQNGKTILNGITDPTEELGNEGDFFINTQTLTFFGPKANDGTWPAGSILKGTSGIGLDFKGSYADLTAYTEAGNTIELNKAYYNTTDKKSYIYTGTGWEIFAQDGTSGLGGALNFNVDRNITRAGLPGAGTNLGAGKTTAQFLEDYFFPRLDATPPTASLSGSSLDIPYATWKNFSSFGTTLSFNYSVTNRSKQDDTEDKDITSIRLLSGGTEVAVASVNNSVNPITGTFTNVAFSNPTGSKTADFSKTFQMEVKDQQPNTVMSNTLTVYMRKANKLTVTTPTISPSTLVYEYGTADIPITLNWTFNKNDETIQDIKVSGVSTGSLTTVTKQVVFKAITNGGTDSQSFPVAITGDIYGVTTVTSPTIKWESILYRGTISSPIAPCEAGFSILDSGITGGSTTKLGGTWKGSTGYDFVCDPSGKYVFYAYPDDGTVPVVEYYDATFQAWQRYPDNQLKIITKTNFENANGYSGKTYKIVFVCVEYKNATVKIRIN